MYSYYSNIFGAARQNLKFGEQNLSEVEVNCNNIQLDTFQSASSCTVVQRSRHCYQDKRNVHLCELNIQLYVMPTLFSW